MPKIRKLVAGSLCAALIWSTPGIGAYRALAAGTRSGPGGSPGLRTSRPVKSISSGNRLNTPLSGQILKLQQTTLHTAPARSTLPVTPATKSDARITRGSSQKTSRSHRENTDSTPITLPAFETNGAAVSESPPKALQTEGKAETPSVSPKLANASHTVERTVQAKPMQALQHGAAPELLLSQIFEASAERGLLGVAAAADVPDAPSDSGLQAGAPNIANTETIILRHGKPVPIRREEDMDDRETLLLQALASSFDAVDDFERERLPRPLREYLDTLETIRNQVYTGKLKAARALRRHNRALYELRLKRSRYVRWGDHGKTRTDPFQRLINNASRVNTQLKRLRQVDAIIFGYVMQQMFLTASFAFHAGLFSAAVKAMAAAKGIVGERYAVTIGRGAYQLGLALWSPFAGLGVEKMTVRSVQKWGFIFRAIIWMGLMPTVWWFSPGLAAFFIGLAVLMLLDAAIVAVQTITDMDEAGLEKLSKDYGFKYDEKLQVRINAIKEGAGSFSRLILAPAMAFLVILLTLGVSNAALGLVLAMGASFGIPALLGTFFLTRYLPRETVGRLEGKRISFRNVVDAFKLVSEKKRWRVRNRLGMNAIDKAIEEMMSFVLFIQFGIIVLAPAFASVLAATAVPELLAPAASVITRAYDVPGGSFAIGAFLGSLLLASGKLGALFASGFMHFWDPPKPHEPIYRPYQRFFVITLIGTLMTSMFVVSTFLISAGMFWEGLGIAGAGSFLFNLFFVPAKQGMQQLMQRILKEEGASGRLFGINSTIKMTTSLIVIATLETLILSLGFHTALPIVVVLLIGYGLFQWIFASRLLFSQEELKGMTPSDAKVFEQLRETLAEEGYPPYRTEIVEQPPAANENIYADVSEITPENLERFAQYAREGTHKHTFLVLSGDWLDPTDGSSEDGHYMLRRGIQFDDAGVPTVFEFRELRPIYSVRRNGHDPPASIAKVGPSWRFRNRYWRQLPKRTYDGGRRKAIVVTGSMHFSRGFVLNDAIEEASELGYEIILVDEESNRPDPAVIPAKNFVPAPIAHHKEENYAAAADAVEEFLRQNPDVDVIGVVPFIEAHTNHSGAILDRLRKVHHPRVFGNTFDTYQQAKDKGVMQRRLEVVAPENTLPAAEVDFLNPTDIPDILTRVRETFAELTADEFKGRQIVMKGTVGSGKVGVRTNVNGPDEAVEAYIDIYGEIVALQQSGKADPHGLDEDPKILMIVQAEGPEVDVEVVRDLNGGTATVMGNPRPIGGQIELGMTLPARLSEDQSEQEQLERMAVEGSIKILDAVGHEVGNGHVEGILDKSGRFVAIEANLRNAGANGVRLLNTQFPGFNVYKQGVRAVTGRRVQGPTEAAHAVIMSRKLVPEHSGRIVSIEVADALHDMPGYENLVLMKKVGDDLLPAERDGFLGHLMMTGSDYAETKERMLKALALITVTVDDKGTRYSFTLDSFHTDEDEPLYQPQDKAARIVPLVDSNGGD